MIRGKAQLTAMIAALAIATAAPTAATAAPSAETPTRQADSTPPLATAPTIGSLIVQNQNGGADQLYAALAPRLFADPQLAKNVITYVLANPEQMELLAEALARIQSKLAEADSEKAVIIEAIVTSAPPVFQAVYADAMASGNNVAESGNEQLADDGDASQDTQPRAYSYMPSSSGGSAGFGGGLVSPN